MRKLQFSWMDARRFGITVNLLAVAVLSISLKPRLDGWCERHSDMNVSWHNIGSTASKERLMVRGMTRIICLKWRLISLVCPWKVLELKYESEGSFFSDMRCKSGANPKKSALPWMRRWRGSSQRSAVPKFWRCAFHQYLIRTTHAVRPLSKASGPRSPSGGPAIQDSSGSSSDKPVTAAGECLWLYTQVRNTSFP